MYVPVSIIDALETKPSPTHRATRNEPQTIQGFRHVLLFFEAFGAASGGFSRPSAQLRRSIAKTVRDGASFASFRTGNLSRWMLAQRAACHCNHGRRAAVRFHDRDDGMDDAADAAGEMLMLQDEVVANRMSPLAPCAQTPFTEPGDGGRGSMSCCDAGDIPPVRAILDSSFSSFFSRISKGGLKDLEDTTAVPTSWPLQGVGLGRVR